QIRHKLVHHESPSFVGAVVSQKRHTMFAEWPSLVLSRMKLARTSLIVAGMAVCAAACVLVWPHAQDAAALLAAQDDPAVFSDLQINSMLRNNQWLFSENIERALAEGDADLANSFVDLAKDKNVALPDDLCRRVGDVLAEQTSAAQIAKRFAKGFVTG